MSNLFYDLHLHSCLSPCADDGCTPYNLANIAALAGLQIVALTDHNTCANCPAFMLHAEKAGLIALPGMELTTSEEVHVVCLFPTLENALAFSDYVYAKLPDIKNRPERFGHQFVCDEKDNVLREKEKYLHSASSIGIYEVVKIVGPYGGVAFPAHLDRGSFSLLSNLGLWDFSMGFSFAERRENADLTKLPNIPYIINSDTHSLESVPNAKNKLALAEDSVIGVIDALRRL